MRKQRSGRFCDVYRIHSKWQNWDSSITHSKKPNTLPMHEVLYLVLDIQRWIRYSSHPLEVHLYPSLTCTLEKKRWASPFTVVHGLRSAMSSGGLKHCVPKRVESPLGRVSWEILWSNLKFLGAYWAPMRLGTVLHRVCFTTVLFTYILSNKPLVQSMCLIYSQWIVSEWRNALYSAKRAMREIFKEVYTLFWEANLNIPFQRVVPCSQKPQLIHHCSGNALQIS